MTRVWMIGGAVLGGIALAGAIYLAGDRNGANRVQLRFDAYKVQVQQEIDAEQDRQRAEAAAAIAELEAALEATEAEALAASQTAADLRALIASRPAVEGRGATEEDVDALNR